MKKKLLTVLLLIMALSISVFVGCNNKPKEEDPNLKFKVGTAGLSYEISRDSTYALCTGIGTATEENIIIAEEFEGLPVAQIKFQAFKDNATIKSVIVPETLESIGNDAFKGCTSLKFKEENGLKYLSSKSNDYYALIENNNKSATNFTMNDGCCAVLNGVFEDMSSAKTIKVSKALKKLPSKAFEGCNSTEELYISSQGEKSFTKDIRQLETYFDEVLACFTKLTVYGSKQDTVITYENGSPITAVIGDSYTEVGGEAFMQIDTLTKLEVNGSVKSLGTNSFTKCIGLKEVKLNPGLENIEEAVFRQCSGIEKLDIPEGVKIIRNHAFEYCSALTELLLPSTLDYVGRGALYCGVNPLNNYSAISTTLKYNEYDNALYLGNENNPYVCLVTMDNYFATTCEIKTGCKIISYRAFLGYARLETVKVPKSLKFISQGAFYEGWNGDGDDPRSLALNYAGTDDDWAGITIETGNNNKTDFLLYTKILIDGKLLTEINLDTTTKVAEGAFRWYSFATKITIGKSVEYIALDAFLRCDNVTQVVFKDQEGWYHTPSSTNWEQKIKGTEMSVKNPTSCKNSITGDQDGRWYYMYKLTKPEAQA